MVNRLYRARLALMRGAWVAVAVLALVVFGAGLPVSVRDALQISAATRAGLAQVGLSAHFPAAFYLTTDILTFVSFSGLAGVLAWRRSHDAAVLFIALMLLLTGLLYTDPAWNAPLPVWIPASLFGLAEIGQVGFFLLFPDGRFIPRWSAWLLLPMLVWRPATWAWLYLPVYRSQPHTAETYGVITQDATDILLLAGLVALGLAAQIYRYRRVSTSAQQQQAKWLLLGSALTVGVVTTYTFLFHVFRLAAPPGASPFFVVAGSRTVRQVALLAVPLAVTISILRYRLFDIDVLINRALVYATLSALLVLVYVGSVVVLQQIFHRLTGEASSAAVVVSTLASAALFQPLRRSVQNGIDRRFYRRKYDVAQTLHRFSTEIRDEVDLERLRSQVVAVVAETLQPAQVSLWLRDDARQAPTQRRDRN